MSLGCCLFLDSYPSMASQKGGISISLLVRPCGQRLLANSCSTGCHDRQASQTNQYWAKASSFPSVFEDGGLAGPSLLKLLLKSSLANQNVALPVWCHLNHPVEYHLVIFMKTKSPHSSNIRLRKSIDPKIYPASQHFQNARLAKCWTWNHRKTLIIHSLNQAQKDSLPYSSHLCIPQTYVSTFPFIFVAPLWTAFLRFNFYMQADISHTHNQVSAWLSKRAYSSETSKGQTSLGQLLVTFFVF